MHRIGTANTATVVTGALLGGLVGLVVTPSAASAVRTTFTQGSGMVIADPTHPGTNSPIVITSSGAASAYPSTVNVGAFGVVTDVDLELNMVDHLAPKDVDILLVGPDGQQATVMSDAGGDAVIADNTQIVLDDEAADPLPGDGQITTGTYRPANYEGTDSFSAPAPQATGASALSVFDGSDPQGTWSLYVFDDTAGLGGDIAGGWFLTIRTSGSPYPGQINVSGLPSRVTDLNVSLGGLTHTFPDDIHALLVGPGGQQATIMSDAGGFDDVTNVDLTFDDEAAGPLPDTGQITTGTYKPTNVAPLMDQYTPPGPGRSNGETSLAVFDDTNPNGVWSLYVVDAFATDSGTLTSWSLDIETDTAPPTGSVSINGGAASTSATAVTLTLSATDPGMPSTGVADVRFSNDGLTFSAFQPYAATAPWELAPGEGTKTVYAQLRDASDNLSSVVSDTITLQLPDTVGPTAKKVSPAKGAKGVGVGTKVKVKASEKLKAGSVRRKTVYLKATGSSQKVAAELSYNASTRTILLNPTGDLKHATTYKVTVKGVSDQAGNKWDEKPKKAGAQALRFSFTTG